VTEAVAVMLGLAPVLRLAVALAVLEAVMLAVPVPLPV
jgi:hypothetical protein